MVDVISIEAISNFEQDFRGYAETVPVTNEEAEIPDPLDMDEMTPRLPDFDELM